MSKNESAKKFHVVPIVADSDIHFTIGDIQDVDAAAAAVAIDAKDDRRWFRRHRNKKVRHRLVSAREQRATGLPAGTMISVLRGPNGCQIRMFPKG